MRMITAFQAENGKIYALEEKANQEDETDRIFNELENYRILRERPSSLGRGCRARRTKFAFFLRGIVG